MDSASEHSKDSVDLKAMGFDTPTFVSEEEYKRFEIAYEEILKRRELRWRNNFHDTVPEKSSKFKRFCRKGIPAKLRPKIWSHLSGAAKVMSSNPSAYKVAASCEIPDSFKHVILADVPRTFPENVYFNTKSGNKLLSLERILTAFAVQFPNIGYCQGMNYIAAILLLVVSEEYDGEEAEEQAFWLLDAMINNILPNYYSSDMVNVRVDCMVFEELLKTKFPEINEVIVNAGINCTLLAAKWFICAFADVLPIETTLRVFDCLFYEGNKILFRTCLTLVKMHHDDLVKCKEFPCLITAFRNMCKDNQTLFCHNFINMMFSRSISISRDKISQLRRACLPKVLAESNKTNQ